MKIQFLGAAQTVTGSRYLLTHGKTNLLVDCGLFQGFKQLRSRNWEPFPIPVSDINAILLTHAHLDHSGYLPLLAKNGYRGPIYATPATIDLCRILLPDSGFLQEEEARFANKQLYSKHHPARPLYTYDDAMASLELLRPAPEDLRISNSGSGGMEVAFRPAGHLLGASSIHVKTDSAAISFSGDLGRKSDPMIRDPDFHFASDTLVVESTYGNRTHPEQNPEEELQKIILRTHERRGILLIPSFAVGRAQLILYYLNRLRQRSAIPSIPIYLDSPMAHKANLAFTAHEHELKISPKELAAIWRGVRIVRSPEESMQLSQSKDPSIIIAASGMATGGRVLHHLKTVAPHARNTILFVGYQAGGTRGDLIVRGADSIKIHGEQWPILAEVINMGSLSAHADANEIISWIKGLKKLPRRAFVTHGESDAATAFRERLTEELGIEAIVPEHGSVWRLS